VSSLEDVYEAYREDPSFAHLRLPNIWLVSGTGASPADFFVVGEAPGATENLKGRPFCGPAGRALNQLMFLAGVRTGWTGKQTGLRVPPGGAEGVPPNAFITNVVKYRPPGNRTPTREEIDASRPYLLAEWKKVGSPDVFVALGAVAKTALGGPAEPISKLAGKPINLKGDRWLWPMFHPAFGLRNPVMRPIMEEHWAEFGEWNDARTGR
jgi:uracil-DNA glycosylase